MYTVSCIRRRRPCRKQSQEACPSSAVHGFWAGVHWGQRGQPSLNEGAGVSNLLYRTLPPDSKEISLVTSAIVISSCLNLDLPSRLSTGRHKWSSTVQCVPFYQSRRLRSGFQGVGKSCCLWLIAAKLAGPIWLKLSDMVLGRWQNVLAK